MLNRFKKPLLITVFSWLIIYPTISFAWHDYTGYGDWDYHGSGRDHPYSAYIDRDTYIGYADYTFSAPDFVSAPMILPAPAQLITPIPALPAGLPGGFGRFHRTSGRCASTERIGQHGFRGRGSRGRR